MDTRNEPLTTGWLLIATGPVSYMSVDISRNGKYSGVQVAFGAAAPAPDFEGHPIPELRGIVLDAGENLYARAVTGKALLIVTEMSAPALKFQVTGEKKSPEPIKLTTENSAKQIKKSAKAGEENG